MYSNYTTEELVTIIAAGEEDAYPQLFRNLTPITLNAARMYHGKMDTYSTEDFLQEGNIVAWKIISRGTYKGGNFGTYYGAAVRKRFCDIFRSYSLKNLTCIGETVDCRGNTTRILVESDYAIEARRKKAEQQKRYYEKKKAAQPPKEKKPPMTKEERIAKQVAYQKAYYAAHPEKKAERLKKNRIKQRERNARRKAARIAAAG